ncbi:hypothetical protein GYMLUDRAFT_251701 [Collybiopsis luxurians FD-317 M1]|uniref:Helicase ATP-binding domain-containing protein n=1 Tax=Collybiopsis luxurians FD-317 M1 TaxID=944289 RepID=A0A0D0C1Z8_9AGAR|nr:hypothetical protein GYMLUDRAFT_251701 [Collybiopsis luxurians FD-317 M1]
MKPASVDLMSNASKRPQKGSFSFPNGLLHEVRPNPPSLFPENSSFGKLLPGQTDFSSRSSWTVSGNIVDEMQPMSTPENRYFGTDLKSRYRDAQEDSSTSLVDEMRSMRLDLTATEDSFAVTVDRMQSINITESRRKECEPQYGFDYLVSSVFERCSHWIYSDANTLLIYTDVTLKPHQGFARTWMQHRERYYSRGGIIADEMGLGKTLQMLVHVIDCRLQGHAEGKSVEPTLIVGTKSILLQWEEEIKQLFCSTPIRLTYILHHGSNRDQKRLAVLGKADIVVTTYGVIMADYERTEVKKWRHGVFQIQWHRVVLDEAHEIRNVQTKKAQAAFSLHASYKWCLTGTPIHNTVSDLQSLFQFIGIESFADALWFRKNISLPISKGGSEGLKAHQLLKVALGKTMLRRLKSDSVNGRPILDLPQITIRIVDCILSQPERNLYKALEAQTAAVDGSANVAVTWVHLLRLRQGKPHFISKLESTF